jgi:hypothetical protein
MVDYSLTKFCITPELYAALKRTGQGPREVRTGPLASTRSRPENLTA